MATNSLYSLILVRHVSFMRHFKKYADHINTKYAAGICGSHLSYILNGVSLAGEAVADVGQCPLLLP